MNDRSIDFEQLYKRMQQAKLAEAERPTILGGEFTAERLDDFLNLWRSRRDAMPYHIWEHISHIEFADEPEHPEFLQRAEIFGEGGHVSLRRDSNRWLWHYIGNQASPAGFPSVDFWQLHSHSQLRRYAESVILWSEKKENDNLWSDGRVAAAQLNYPVQSDGRVYLHFWRYTENGQTAFVWYRKLSDRPLREEDSA